MRVQHYRAETYRVTEAIGYLLRFAHKLSVPLAEDAFVGEELSFSNWIALILLRDGIVDTCGALARCLGHNSGATTRMLDQLEERGLVTRQRSAADRRVVNVTLTAAGSAAADRLVPKIVDLWNELLVDFDADEAALLRKLLQRLVARLEAFAAMRGEA